MDATELKTVLEEHLKWLNSEQGGEKANLRGADLSKANLRGANLRVADLRVADLRGANLRGADIDLSAWPLWCGSIGAKIDYKIGAQIALHFVGLDSDDPEIMAAQKALLPLAEKSHRWDDCKSKIKCEKGYKIILKGANDV